MQFRQLGRSGLTVSAIGLGCNSFGRGCDMNAARAVVHAALDAGVTLFDTADVYGTPRGLSEEYLGKALGSHREEVVLATKFGNPAIVSHTGSSRRYIKRAVEESLRRLGTDRIDLYQLHASDGRAPIEETLLALDDLITEGKINYAGSSMCAEWEIAEAELVARREVPRARFISTQSHFSLLHREPEREMVRACSRFGIGIIPFFPLARGLLTGKYHPGKSLTPKQSAKLSVVQLDDAKGELLGRLISFAESRSVALYTVAIGWLLSRSCVSTVIAGATKPGQVQANVDAIEWTPTFEDLAELDELVPPPEASLHRARPVFTR